MHSLENWEGDGRWELSSSNTIGSSLEKPRYRPRLGRGDNLEGVCFTLSLGCHRAAPGNVMAFLMMAESVVCLFLFLLGGGSVIVYYSSVILQCSAVVVRRTAGVIGRQSEEAHYQERWSIR